MQEQLRPDFFNLIRFQKLLYILQYPFTQAVVEFLPGVLDRWSHLIPDRLWPYTLFLGRPLPKPRLNVAVVAAVLPILNHVCLEFLPAVEAFECMRGSFLVLILAPPFVAAFIAAE